MHFKSCYTADEIQSILDEKTEKYSFYNLNMAGTMLSQCKGKKIVLCQTKDYGEIHATKLTSAFYGKICERNGETVLRGHFRLSNIDIISWFMVFVLLMLTVFLATQGSVALKFFNTGIMSVVWCALCGIIAAAESIENRTQKRAVVKFIEENLLKQIT